MTHKLGYYHIGEFLPEVRVTHHGMQDNLTYIFELPGGDFVRTLVGAAQPRAAHARDLLRHVEAELRRRYPQ